MYIRYERSSLAETIYEYIAHIKLQTKRKNHIIFEEETVIYYHSNKLWLKNSYQYILSGYINIVISFMCFCLKLLLCLYN